MLSMRSNKTKKYIKCTLAKENNVQENDVSEQKFDEQSHRKNLDITITNNIDKEETTKQEKKKKENILERLIKLFSIGPKKENSAATNDTEVDKTKEES